MADLRRVDAQRRDEARRGGQASGTTLTQVFGVGPVIAGTIIGDVTGVTRFPSRGHFAACNGTAPVEVSSGDRKIRRLPRRGNRRLNHAIHIAAITQIRHRHSDGRAYYDKKIAKGKTRKRRSGPQTPDQQRLSFTLRDQPRRRLRARHRCLTVRTSVARGAPGSVS